MRSRGLAAVALGALLLAPAAGQSVAPLPERHRAWLDEEVAYIITPREREVFRKLQTDKERDIFTEAFWKHRDPLPETPRNEFREEHYRRLSHANSAFGRSTPLPGWKTDRGRIHILLGPPKNIEQYANVNGVYPVEVWFYLGDEALGLPTGFNIVFFKRNGTGDYVLYSPDSDGPGSLIADSVDGYRETAGIPASWSEEAAAYKALQQLEPNLARQSLSLIPGEAAQPGRASLASSRLIAAILDLPRKRVDADYAEAILRYKDFIEVEYTANYISSDVLVHVIRDAAGAAFVHYTIEPAKITAEEAGQAYEVRFRLTGRVSDTAGRTVYQFDKEFPFGLTRAELEEARAKSISIQDAFPLVPGSYTFDILLKNVLSKEFTGAGQAVVVAPPAGPPALGRLLLAYRAERRPSPPGERVPFKVGDDQLLCQARRTFGAADTLAVFFQLAGVTDELRRSGTIRTRFLRDGAEVLTRTAGVPAGSSVLDLQPLAGFRPGYYQVRVTLLDGRGGEVAGTKEDFEISLADAVPRPIVLSKVTPAVKRQDDLLLAGIQTMNTGNLTDAAALLGEAYGLEPGRRDLALAYAQALFKSADHRRAKAVLLPFAGEAEPEADVLALLGLACQALDELSEAASHYRAYLARFGANVDILNRLGTCEYKQGNAAEAVRAWTKSLELSPNQDNLRALLESLKRK